MRVIPVFFDFACPYSYSARGREKRFARELGVEFEYLPWDLDPDLPAEGTAWTIPLDDDLYALARDAGRELRPVERRWNTRKALRGLLVARAFGVQDAYVERGLDAFWHDNVDLHDDHVLAGIAAACGIDGEAFVQAVNDPAWDAHLSAVDGWGEHLHVKTTVTYVLPEGAYQGLGPQDEVRRRLAAAVEMSTKAATSSRSGSATIKST